MVEAASPHTGHRVVVGPPLYSLTLAPHSPHAAINWGPNQSKADRGTRSIFHLLDRKTAIDNMSPDGERPDGPLAATSDATPLLELKDVTFKYPSRPDTAVLRGLSLRIYAGQKVRRRRRGGAHGACARGR